MSLLLHANPKFVVYQPSHHQHWNRCADFADMRSDNSFDSECKTAVLKSLKKQALIAVVVYFSCGLATT